MREIDRIKWLYFFFDVNTKNSLKKEPPVGYPYKRFHQAFKTNKKHKLYSLFVGCVNISTICQVWNGATLMT